MINITINGKDVTIENGQTAEGLLEERKIIKGSIWVNGNQLLKKEYETTTFHDGDQVKILRLVSGG